MWVAKTPVLFEEVDPRSHPLMYYRGERDHMFLAADSMNMIKRFKNQQPAHRDGLRPCGEHRKPRGGSTSTPSAFLKSEGLYRCRPHGRDTRNRSRNTLPPKAGHPQRARRPKLPVMCSCRTRGTAGARERRGVALPPSEVAGEAGARYDVTGLSAYVTFQYSLQGRTLQRLGQKVVPCRHGYNGLFRRPCAGR